jgi:WD40 repeat protein
MRKLTFICSDDKHSVAVWDWKAGTLLAHAEGHTDKIFTIDFNPYDENQLVTAGINHIVRRKIAVLFEFNFSIIEILETGRKNA